MGASVWRLFFMMNVYIQLDMTYKLYSHIQLTWHKQIFFHIYLLYAIHGLETYKRKAIPQGKRSLPGKNGFNR
jgi:hypothetical protein